MGRVFAKGFFSFDLLIISALTYRYRSMTIPIPIPIISVSAIYSQGQYRYRYRPILCYYRCGADTKATFFLFLQKGLHDKFDNCHSNGNRNVGKYPSRNLFVRTEKMGANNGKYRYRLAVSLSPIPIISVSPIPIQNYYR